MSGRTEIKSLIDQGYDPLHTEHWEAIEFDDKLDHLSLIDQRLKSFRKPDMQVRIGDTHFDCHSLLLQCYSEAFDELENERAVILPQEKVTPEAFQIIYAWMLAPKADIKREHFVEVFVAAEYLRIKHLINQCWICMDSIEALVEDRAFLLYIEAARFQQTILQNMLLKRICKFFLPLVASREFMQLPLEDLNILLKSSYIGVFSEADVFYAACIWLLEDWENRQEHVSEVMNLVRFTLIRPSLLAQLNSFDADERIHDILRHETTKYLVAQALNYAFSSKSFAEMSDHRLSSRRANRVAIQKLADRTWLEDLDAFREEGEMGIYAFTPEDYSYETFLERLGHLSRDRDCWKRWQKVEINVESLLTPRISLLKTPSDEHGETSGIY
ncbi:actin-binding protein IPP-like [Ochlerotatus camptorhynchus]|uniref:actin-binding protein IPP-like n=1 Tax=Ochlerotatus camptorhynchus TaxID=644619 RepID=UPI0031E3C801